MTTLFPTRNRRGFGFHWLRRSTTEIPVRGLIETQTRVKFLEGLSQARHVSLCALEVLVHRALVLDGPVWTDDKVMCVSLRSILVFESDLGMRTVVAPGLDRARLGEVQTLAPLPPFPRRSTRKSAPSVSHLTYYRCRSLSFCWLGDGNDLVARSIALW